MISDSESCAGYSSRQDTGRSVARRPTGFTSLQLLRQNKERMANRMAKIEPELVEISTQTDGAIVVLWMQDLMGTMRSVVPTRLLCVCDWTAYFWGRHWRSTSFSLVLLFLLYLIVDLLLSILGKWQRLR